MTTIKTVPGIDNTKLTEIARSLVKNSHDPDNTQLIKAFTVVIDTIPPKAMTVSFDELEGLINIMDLTRPIKAKLEPAQWVIMTYQLNDLDALLGEGYRVTEYVINLDAGERAITFTGTISHVSTIKAHPEYNPESTISSKVFEYILEDFDIIQQMAITRVMASRDVKFDQVAGTFDVSWTYTFAPSGISFSTEGIDE